MAVTYGQGDVFQGDRDGLGTVVGRGEPGLWDQGWVEKGDGG